MSTNVTVNERPQPDILFVQIADYVTKYSIKSPLAFETAHYDLMDSLGCGFLALRFPECTKHLGPIVPETHVPNGARVPGTPYVLDPVKAAWDIGCIIRWLDYNDTWLAEEWGHPSDNLGGILAITDFISRTNIALGKPPLLMESVLSAMIKAHEIQGVLALNNSFNKVGLDHILLVKIASVAVITHLLGGTKAQIITALTHAFADGGTLRTYRHAPNAGSRKSWAAGDATARAVQLALITLKGEMGLPSVLSAPTWGFQDVLFNKKPITLSQPLESYVMENILFKISYPAEFHAQTAVEIAATQLHKQVKDKIPHIQTIRIHTHEAAIRIISKKGKLNNPADRDHCLQYMVACALLFGNLTAEHYEEDTATIPTIDILREKMEIIEDPQYSKDYLDPQKRSIANAIQIFFENGAPTEKIALEYPIGHKRRRKDGIPLLKEKFIHNVHTRFPKEKAKTIIDLLNHPEQLRTTPVQEFISALIM